MYICGWQYQSHFFFLKRKNCIILIFHILKYHKSVLSDVLSHRLPGSTISLQSCERNTCIIIQSYNTCNTVRTVYCGFCV